MLRLLGLAVERQGNVLSVLGRQLEVLEACNGMRYGLALGFVAVVMAYLSGSRPWTRRIYHGETLAPRYVEFFEQVLTR